MIAPPCPVVDAYDGGRRSGWCPVPADDPEQCVVADTEHQPFGERRGWPPAEGKAEMMDEPIETSCTPCPTREDAVRKSFGEDATAALYSFASETSHGRDQYTMRPANGRSASRRR